MDIKRVIVFAPHPDDETLGCGGTIAKKVAQGYHVLIIVMTDGRYAFSKVFGVNSNPTPEELKEIRKEEVKKAVKILGLSEESLIFLDFVDGTLPECREKVEKKVVEILSENCPAEIYLPHRNDAHLDHRVAYQIVKKAVKKLGISTRMYQYLITPKYERLNPFINKLIDHFRRNVVYVDISEFLETKKAAIKEFKTEITRFLDKQKKPVVPNIKRFLGSKEVFYSE